MSITPNAPRESDTKGLVTPNSAKRLAPWVARPSDGDRSWPNSQLCVGLPLRQCTMARRRRARCLRADAYDRRRRGSAVLYPHLDRRRSWKSLHLPIGFLFVAVLVVICEVSLDC